MLFHIGKVTKNPFGAAQQVAMISHISLAHPIDFFELKINKKLVWKKQESTVNILNNRHHRRFDPFLPLKHALLVLTQHTAHSIVEQIVWTLLIYYGKGKKFDDGRHLPTNRRTWHFININEKIERRVGKSFDRKFCWGFAVAFNLQAVSTRNFLIRK